MKILRTGVIITYDKKGNVKQVISPYWQDEKKQTLINKVIHKLYEI